MTHLHNEHCHPSRGGIFVSRRHNSYGYGHHHHSPGISPLEAICCGALIGASIVNPRFGIMCLSVLAVTVLVACLATMTMGITGDVVLSVLLIAAVVAGLAALCSSANNQQNQPTAVTCAY